MKYISRLLEAIKILLAEFVLKNKIEKFIFLFFFIFIFLTQFQHFQFLSNNTKILGYDPYIWQWIADPFSSFATIKHPLINVFIIPFILIVAILKFIIAKQYALYCVYTLFHFSVLYSLIFVYRILSEVVRIGQFRSVLLTILFSSFAHIIIQFYIIELYSLSLMLLTLTIYIVGKQINLKEKSNSYVYGLLFLCTAGVTITNGVKTIIAYLMTQKGRAKKLKWIVTVSVVFLGLVIAVYLPIKLFATTKPPIEKSISQDKPGEVNGNNNSYLVKKGLQVTKYKIPFLNFIRFDIDFGTSFKENILGESTLFHTADFKSEIQSGRDIYLRYASTFFNAVIMAFYIFLLLSIIFSLNQKYSHFLLAFLSVDVFIHIICRFGITEPYIFAAHWMFFIPIFFSFLYKSEHLKKAYHVFDGIFILFSVFFLYNNWAVVFQYLNSDTSSWLH